MGAAISKIFEWIGLRVLLQLRHWLIILIVTVHNGPKVRRVILVPDRWNDRRFLIPNQCPVDALEERMFLNVGSTVLVTESLVLIRDEQLDDQILAVLGHVDMLWKFQLFVQNVGKGLILTPALERRRTVQHLIHQYTKGPPIDR